MINLSHNNVLSLINPHHVKGARSESASFLIWYFINYLRMDEIEAVESVCDQRGDKGIDGIVINDNENTIEIYQIKLCEKEEKAIGENDLKKFYASVDQIKSEEKISSLVEVAGDNQLTRLIERLNLMSRVKTHKIVGYFVCNANIGKNGENYLKSLNMGLESSNMTIKFKGRDELQNTFISSERELPTPSKAKFNISGYQPTEYAVDKNKAIIAPVKANDLINLKGIEDQRIFTFNVRQSLGRKSAVNREIEKSIRDSDMHREFPLFHNGITIIAESVEKTDNDEIEIENYFVVNGCQSLRALYDNRDKITEDLRILTKFIKTSPGGSLSEKITQISNNQNGVKPRDFKSNDGAQIRLQREFRQHYYNRYFFEIKRGELPDNSDEEIISNEDAGLYLMSFDLMTPWETPRRYQIFEDKYLELFGGRDVTAHKIAMCHEIFRIIHVKHEGIKNKYFSKYVLTRFLILYIVRCFLDGDDTAKDVVNSPEQYMSDELKRKGLAFVIESWVNQIIIYFNRAVPEEEESDYRGKLRDKGWCEGIKDDILTVHETLVSYGDVKPFKELLERGMADGQ